MAKTTSKKDAKLANKKKVEEKAAAVSSSESGSDSSSSSSSDSSSDSESDSSSSDEEEEKKEEEKKDESSSDSDSDSSSSDEEEEKKDENKEESSSSSSSDSESGSDSSSDSDSESESEETNDKKRKAESESESDSDADSKKQKTEEEETGEEEEPSTIFVGRLSWSIDGDWLKSEFDHIGGVLGARVIYERGTDRSKGYGYVDFKTKALAEKAVAEMQGKEIDGREINCDMSNSRPATNNNNGGDRARKFGDVPSEPSDTLFLGNLSFNANRDEISDIFAKFGEIVSVRLPTHPETEQPKGFGYVQYGNIDDAKKALEALQGEYIDNRPVRLDYSTPRPQNDRGGFGGNRGGRGGFRPSGSGANQAPLGRARNTAEFSGNKKTFD